MDNYNFGDIVLLQLPFTDPNVSKRRPVLVVLDVGDRDIVVMRITSKITRTPFDIEVTNWQQAGLLRKSIVRTHKVNTIEKNLVDRQLGRLTEGDRQRVRDRIRQLWLGIR